MKNKKLIIISILSIIGIIVVALATSYALFNINVTKDKINKIVMGNLELSINDSNNTFTDGKIVVNNMVPMKDATGMAQDGYSFTLTNTGSIDAGYSIFIDDVVVANLPSGITGRLDNSKVRVNLTNITTNTSNTYTLSSLTDRKLETGTLDAGDTNSYVLRIWLDYTAGNESQNKYFAVKIRIDSIQKNSIDIPIKSCPGCRYLYTTDTYNYGTAGSTLAASDTKADYNDVISESGKQYFLGVILSDGDHGTIERAFACGIKDSIPFCIEGRTDGTLYSSNKSFLNSLYGPYDESTKLGCYDYDSNVRCNGSVVNAGAYNDGSMITFDGIIRCGINSSGELYCREW